jgi:hypothetical protein
MYWNIVLYYRELARTHRKMLNPISLHAFLTLHLPLMLFQTLFTSGYSLLKLSIGLLRAARMD